MHSLAYDVEFKLRAMTLTAKALSDKIQVIREDDYLVVEHDVYGHVTELHPDDYDHCEEMLRDELTSLSNAAAEEDLPW